MGKGAPAPSVGRSGEIQVPADRDIPTASGGVDNVDTWGGKRTVEDKPILRGYSSQRSREINDWMKRILTGPAEDTREELNQVKVSPDGHRSKAKFTPNAMEEWLDGVFSAMTGPARASMGISAQRTLFRNESPGQKRKRDMFGSGIKATFGNVVKSTFRKKIKIAEDDVFTLPTEKQDTSDSRREKEYMGFRDMVSPPIGNIRHIFTTKSSQIIENEVLAPPTQTQATSRSKNENESAHFRNIVPAVENILPVLDNNILLLYTVTETTPRSQSASKIKSIIPPSPEDIAPVFATKSSRILGNMLTSPNVRGIPGSLQRKNLTVLRKTVTPQIEENLLPIFATKSSHVLENNVLKPITKPETKVTSRGYIPTICGKNATITRKNCQPMFATKSSRIFDKNFLSPSTENKATSYTPKKGNKSKSGADVSTASTPPMFAKGSRRIFDKGPSGPTIPKAAEPTKYTPTIHNKGRSRAEYNPPSTPTTKLCMASNNALTPGAEKMPTPVIADVSRKSIRDSIPSKAPVKYSPVVASRASSISTDKKSIPEVAGISSKAAMKGSLVSAGNNNIVRNNILTPTTGNKTRAVFGTKSSPAEVKYPSGTRHKAMVDVEVKSAYQNSFTPTVRREIPEPGGATQVNPRTYKPTTYKTNPSPAKKASTATTKTKVTSAFRKNPHYLENVLPPTTETKIRPTIRRNSLPAVDKKVGNEKAVPTTETFASESTRFPAVGVKTWPLKLTPNLCPREGRCFRAAKLSFPAPTTGKENAGLRSTRRILFLD